MSCGSIVRIGTSARPRPRKRTVRRCSRSRTIGRSGSCFLVTHTSMMTGRDLEQLELHAELTREVDGLYGVNLGDTTNNWVGRLARLYAEQGTTASEAWVLAEFGCARSFGCSWSAVITTPGLGPVTRSTGSLSRCMSTTADAVRARLMFPNNEDLTIHARHTFPGHSQWNTTHGVWLRLPSSVTTPTS